jgi:hypothetical protein
MKVPRIALVMLAGAAIAQAQDVKVNALVELWYTQMLDSNLRLDAASKVPASAYYDGLSSGRFAENGFYVKRTEITLQSKITDEISWNVMFDPNLSTSTVGNNVLQDAIIAWAPAGTGLTFRMGQFKMPTTYEATLIAAKDIYFFDRNQLNRVLGDKRDRGLWASYAVGSDATFLGRFNVAVSNGNNDDGSSGKSNEVNAQKDVSLRFDAVVRKTHRFGVYYREGETNLKSATSNPAAISATWVNGAPTAQDLLDNRDKTTLAGAFYAYDQGAWHLDAEAATGLLGRRFPLLFLDAAKSPAREHLDQKFLAYALTGVYTMGHHQFLARYDFFNYNQGDDWYTAANPYKPATGANAGGDFTPKYTEAVVGYNYLFNPTKASYGKVKVDYIFRSKNFLAPRSGQTGEQGGDSLVLSLSVGF